MLQKQKALWRGIRRHGAGWQLEVRVKRHPRHVEQFPLETDPIEIQKRRARIKRELRDTLPPAASGTFAKDVKTYLEARKANAERRRIAMLWVSEFGSRHRASIKPYEILAVVNRWLTEGPKLKTVPGGTRKHPTIIEVAEPLSPSQVRNRMRVLENLWTVLDGRHAYNPVREVDEPQDEERDARGLPYDIVVSILNAMPDRGRPTDGTRGGVSLTKLRLNVIAYTGLSHGELMRIRKIDLHLDESSPWVWVHGRKKGKGTGGTAQPLTEEGAAALGELADANGLGSFSPSAMWKSFQRACQKLGLEGVTPYDFRHSFASEVFEKTDGNLAVTQLMMRHKDQRTTLRYAKKAIDPVRAAAIAKVRAAGGFR